MITEENKYDWAENMPAYEHQRKALEETWNRKYYGLFWEMGVGKTKPVIETSLKLFNAGEIDGVLIIAPKGAYRTWIDYELPAHMPPNIPYRMAVWASVMNKKAQWQYSQILCPQDNLLDFLCINVEAFSGERALDVAKAFIRSHYTMIVIDESVTIKSMRSLRTKRILKLRDLVEYRRILSGAPITQGPLDLFSQCEFLCHGILGFTSFTAFRSYYADIRTIQFGPRSFPKIFGYRHTEEITAKLQGFTSRLLKQDCLDLPEKIYEVFHVDHSPEQSRLYYEMRDEALSMLDGETMLSSTNALTTLMKLQQINCGHIKDDDGVTHMIPNGRISALLELLETIPDKKAIIWGYFRADMAAIEAALKEHYPGKAVFYHGGKNDEERKAAVQAFRMHPEVLYFVGTQATGGRSLTLVEADTTIYYSQGYNLEHRLQSEDRNHRIGQRKTVTYIDLIVPRTVDEKISRALRSKRDLAATILNDFRTLLETV